MSKNISKEDLLADIRNKLGNAAALISLVDLYFGDKELSEEKTEYVLERIKQCIPKALESIDYVRQFEFKDKPSDNSKETHIFFH